MLPAPPPPGLYRCIGAGVTGWSPHWMPSTGSAARRRAGMFAFPDVTGLLRPGQTAAGLADELLQTAHVATVPGDAFDAPGHLRVCFAVADDTLDEAILRLTRALTRPSQDGQSR